MSLGHPPHLGNFDYTGMYYYSLTWCCDRRQRLFTQPDRVDFVREQILRAARKSEFEVSVDCYMPDHVHKLVRGRSATANALKFIKLATQCSGFHFKQTFKLRLWQRYGHDRFLRQDKDVWRVIQYIVNNPIRAGLVERIEDYPFIGSETYWREELNEISRMEWSG